MADIQSPLDLGQSLIIQADESFWRWIFTGGFYIALTLLVALLSVWLFDRLIAKIVSLLPTPEHISTKVALIQRRDTLIRIFQSVFRAGIWISAFLIIMSQVGINLTPFLAAAGAAGIAVGFGGQYLARDIITGFFVTLENQYRLGDYVCFEKTCGYVERVTLRMTTLRDFDGTVYHVPHGSITRTANYSKGHGRIFFDFVVSYDNDMEKVALMINRVGKELSEDPVWKKSVTLAPYFLRIESFGDPGMTIKIAGTTAPGKQWDVSGELRRRLKVAADAEGIMLPRNLGYYTAPKSPEPEAKSPAHPIKAEKKKSV